MGYNKTRWYTKEITKYGKDIDTSLSKTDMLKQLEEHIGSLSKEQLNELSRIAS